ncbi:MAG TPA: DUF6624 domain-containing protein [Puia sp.]
MKKTISILALIVVCNMSFGQNKIYDSLRYQLLLIEQDDQGPRMQLDSISGQYAGDSSLLMKQLSFNSKIMKYNDSIDLLKVRSILDKYGWLGPDEIGDDGCSTLFLVIQHADLKTQENYLPTMRAAVNAGKAKASRLALLEDRVALRQGRKQIYGSQIYLNVITKEMYVLPLLDPNNVNLRRSKVGLQSMEEYMQGNFNMKWDISQYYKDLPTADSLLKASHFLN